MKTISYNEAYSLTKSRPEAFVLQHISHWQPKAKITFNGHTWVVRTAEEFIKYGATYSEVTIRRAVRSLAKKGLLIVKHKPHPLKSGIMKASWIRIADGHVATKGVKTLPLNRSKVSVQTDQKVSTIIQDNQQDNHQDNTSPPKMAGEKITSLKDLSAEEIKKKFKPKKPNSEKPLNPTTLFEFIRAVQHESHPNHPLGDKTGKALGQCKTILQRLRDNHNLSDDQIREVIESVISVWVSFKDHVQITTAKLLHPFPTLDQMTTHCFHMVTYHQTKSNTSTDDEGYDPDDVVVVAVE